jgi:hypothetical protein
LYPNFDFDNVETLLLKKPQKAGDRLPQLGYLSRLGGIQSKCGAAQFATAGSGWMEPWHDALALRFDGRRGALRGAEALKQRRAGLGLGQCIRQTARSWGHPNGSCSRGSGWRDRMTISRIVGDLGAADFR